MIAISTEGYAVDVEELVAMDDYGYATLTKKFCFGGANTYVQKCRHYIKRCSENGSRRCRRDQRCKYRSYMSQER